MISKERIEAIRLEFGGCVVAYFGEDDINDLCQLALEALRNRQWTPEKSRPVDIGECIGIEPDAPTAQWGLNDAQLQAVRKLDLNAGLKYKGPCVEDAQ